MKAGHDSSATWGNGAVFSAVFTLYVWTSHPSLAWLDSPELAAASAELGVAHSPGHPLATFVGKLATFFPVGAIDWRVNIMSSLLAALAILALAAACRDVLQRTAPDVPARARAWIAASLALVAAVGPALWGNAGRAEVYALQGFLSWSVLWLWLRYESRRESRYLLMLAVALGFAAANHYVMAAPLGFFAVLWVWRWAHLRSRVLWSCLLGLGALCAVTSILYLPVRAAVHPLTNWGVPTTVQRLVWTLSGRAFSRNIAGDHASSFVEDAVQAGFAVVQSVSIPLALLAIFALLSPLLRLQALVRTQARLWFVMAAAAALAIGLRALLGYDSSTPDHDAYLLAAVGIGVILASAAVGLLCQSAVTEGGLSGRRVTLVVVGLLCGLAAALGALRWDDSSRRGSWSGHEMARWEIEDLPPRSLVLLSYYQSSFRQQALAIIDGARPDVDFLDRSFLTYPGHAEEAQRRYPELSELIGAPLVAGRATPVALLHALAARRPVFLQLHLNVDSAAKQHLWPAGAFAAWAPGESAGNYLERDARSRRDIRARLANEIARDEVRAALLWHDVIGLDHLCERGETRAAQAIYEQASVLAPEDATLDELRIACGLVR